MTSRDQIRFDYADSTFGQLHYAEIPGPTDPGSSPLLLFHQTPRSWDEFREFMPPMAHDRRVVAMDMVGFGASAKPQGPQSIEMYSQAAVELLDALGIDVFHVLGHHTGALVALDIAVGAQHRVLSVILSSCPYPDAVRRTSEQATGGVDQAVQDDAGGHLTRLWELRRPYYPYPVAPLLDRFVHDATTFGVDPAEGHRACARYRIEDRIGHVHASTLLLASSDDPFSMPNLPALQRGLAAVASLSTHVVAGGTVAVFEDRAVDVAGAVLEFLDGLNVSG